MVEGLAGGPGIERLQIEGDVFAGVAAAQHLSGLFAGVGEHDAAKREPRVALVQSGALDDAPALLRGEAGTRIASKWE